MAIPTILKGDTPQTITLSMADGWDYTGCTLRVTFGAVSRSFTNLKAGDSVSLSFTSTETAAMSLGTSHVTLELVNDETGAVAILPWSKIKVTDAPGLVYPGSIDIDPAGLRIDDLTAHDSTGAIKSAVNAILAFLRNGAA